MKAGVVMLVRECYGHFIGLLARYNDLNVKIGGGSQRPSEFSE